MKWKTRPKMTVWRYLALGYLITILLGSLLLMLPFASAERVSYLDALFTSTSATCVTGLVPFDTATHWTLFGQIVILLLIQTGGLGFTTFVCVIFLMVRRGLGLYEKNAMIRSLGGTRLTGIKTLVLRIIIGTATLETAGALLLCIRFIPDFGAANGIYYAIFHSVSAFCNAGFDLMGVAQSGASISLSAYAGDPIVSLTICALIVTGGLGFCLWGDVFDSKGNPRKLQFYTRVILIANTILLVVPTLLFLLFERNAAFAGCGFGEQVLRALFSSTTARTAGFFTCDPMSYSQSGYLLTVILMFVGGNSGSTAGGIKVGTFTVIMVGMFAALRGKRDINLGKRRIEFSLVSQALAIFTAYLMLVLCATLCICAIETDASFANVLFTAVSALGTVGLARMEFGIASKIVFILLMYLGRVGVLTLSFALRKKRAAPEVRRPVENFFIG